MPDLSKDAIDTYYDNLRDNVIAPSLRSSDPSRFTGVQEQQGIEAAQERADYMSGNTLGARAGKSFMGALDTTTSLGSITEELGKRSMLFSEGGLKAAVFEDPLREEGWSFEDNSQSRAAINKRITELGLDVEGSDARRMRTSRSSRELDLMTDRVMEKQDHARHVQKSGVVAGELASFMGSIPDLDLVIGGAAFKPLKAGAQANKLRVAASLLPKGDNLYTGAKAGFLASVTNEGAKYAVDDADPQEMLGTVAFSTLFGLGIGGIVPTQKGNDFVDYTATKAAARSEDKFLREHPEIKGFSKSMAFTGKWEGGMANVVGDRGGRTAYGISEAAFPKQYAQMTKILETKGEGAAKQYRDNFFKTKIYDKVVTPDMDARQAQVMFDTAVLSGPARAKKLWKQSNGDVGKFLDTREQFFRDIVKNDPSQAKFLDGWLNRNDDLRKSVKGTPQQSPIEARTETLDTDPTPTTLEDVDVPQTASMRLREALDAEDAPIEVKPDEAPTSVGASAGPDGDDAPQIRVTEKSKEILDFVHNDFAEDTELSHMVRNYFDFTDPERSAGVRAWQTGVQRIYEGMAKLRMLPDHDKAMRTGNAPLQWLALKLTNSPLGLAAVQTADNVAVRMEDSFRAQYAQYYGDNFTEWANNKGYNFTEKRILTEAEDSFNREVQRELNARRYGGTYTDDTVIARAADDYGNTTALMLDELKAAKVEGFEDVAHDRGYFPVRHDKNKVLDWEHKVDSDNLVQSYKNGIIRHNQRTGGDITEQEAFTWATAILRHARERSGVSPTSSLQTMSEDGRAFIEDALRLNGVSEDKITEAADKMLYKNSETGTVKRSRRRIGVDYSTPIVGSKDGQLFDLIDQDAFGALDSMTRGQAGEIGRVTATDGLFQKKDTGAWLDAIKDDARQRGVDPTRDLEIANDILSQFSEGAYSGGVSKFTSRLNRGTTLSFMAQLGLPQLAETGVMMAKGGTRGFQDHIGESVQAFMKRQPERLTNSLAVSGEYLRPDELMGKVLNLDEVAFGDAASLGKMLDTALDRGSRVLGEVSLFYRLTGAQQTASLKINNQFMFDSVLKDNVSKARLMAMGISDEVAKIARKYSDVIERNPETGGIIDNHFEHWSKADRDRWRDVIRQNVDYDVQTTRRGFGHAIAQKNDMAAISLKLKSFAMNAFFSKALRNARLADRIAAAEIAWNLGWSSLAVGAAATVNGQWDEMTPDRYAQRVLSWTAHISPVLMGTDVISYMLGLDQVSDVKSSGIQRYRGHGDGLMNIAPPIAAANNILSLGRIPGSLIEDGDLERDNINALKSVPIVGRMYGVPLLLEEFYDSLK